MEINKLIEIIKEKIKKEIALQEINIEKLRSYFPIKTDKYCTFAQVTEWNDFEPSLE